MRRVDDKLLYSATDLVGYLECRHLTELERAAEFGSVTRPLRDDPVLDRLAKRGKAHEERLLDSLSSQGVTAATIDLDSGLSYFDRHAKGQDDTRSAMASGVDLIYQAVLFDGARLGYADFLRRVEQPSGLGEWGYEVWDAKLARHAKAPAVLQLCMYSDMVGELQGCPPQEMHLALGGVEQQRTSFRFADFSAYYRLVVRNFEEFLSGSDGSELTTYPEPVDHCRMCRWSSECRDRWRADDDLSLVAHLTSRQRRALHSVGVTTRKGLGEPETPLPEPVDGISTEALANIQAQAAIQIEGGRRGATISRRIDPRRDGERSLAPNHGLLMLPEPSLGDLFLDIEGDPFYGTEEVDGIDYLFGVIEPAASNEIEPTYLAFWAIEQDTVTTAAEKRAFEELVDFFIARLEADPAMHIYHYAPYEPTAIKRLAGRYGTRESEVDRLLRGEVFVDLYRATRQGIRASVENYSLKRLEPLYSFVREIELRDANSSIVEFETWLELGQDEAGEQILDQIEAYNRDDCLSTLHLRDWLECQRAELAIEIGSDLPRPSIAEPEETEDSDAQKEVNRLAANLCDGLPESVEQMDSSEHGRWLLAQLLNWHRREAKSSWWRYFYLKNELSDIERREQSEALGQLTYVDSWSNPAPRARSTMYQFRFPPQEHAIEARSQPRDPKSSETVGEVDYVDDEAGEIVIKRSNTKPALYPTSLIPLDLVAPRPKPESLQRLARWVIDHDIDSNGSHQAARDLLTRTPPHLGQSPGQPLLRSDESPQAGALRLSACLHDTYLAIQGPPGSGKSTLGAEMVVELVSEGKQIGITANSHKVIGELLKKVADKASERGISVAIGQRTNGEPADSRFTHLDKNDKACAALADSSVDVVGATTWLWAREDVTDTVDVLFIDEAGQMSLADAIAASPCAKSLVLLGDPQQLDQPLQGTHPPGSERSALAHLLQHNQVMPEHLGLFLDRTWRLHPDICEYTSEVFYEGQLQPQDGTGNFNLTSASTLSGTGLRHVAASHSGRTSESPEEVELVAGLVNGMVGTDPEFTDSTGQDRPVDETDVLIVAPYNAQVRALSTALPQGRIGTVDKFQGQEAPISVYSMSTSSADEAPHGMEFLYSLNRLNVATSRAQCLAVVVGSPGLIDVSCRTPRQMKLVNALARFIEMASRS